MERFNPVSDSIRRAMKMIIDRKIRKKREQRNKIYAD